MSYHQCIRCGAVVGDMQIHTCPPSHQPPFWPLPPTVPSRLTEADIRRIVREEIDKARAEMGREDG